MNMGNEMGNSNVSGLKEENTTVEALVKPSEESNHIINDEKRENQSLPPSEEKDFHEKVEEWLSSDERKSDGKQEDDTELKPSSQTTEVVVESNDKDSQDIGIKVASSTEVNSIEKATESNLEDNLSRTSEREEEDKSNSNSDTKSTSVAPESLESVAPKSNQLELDEAEEKRNLSQSKTTQTLAESVVSDAIVDEEKIKDESLVKEPVSQEENLEETNFGEDEHEIGAKDKVQNGLRKCNEGVPTELNLGRNGSSKSTQEVISWINSSNSFQVHEPQDKCMVLTEDTKVFEDNNHDLHPIESHEQAMNELRTDEVSQGIEVKVPENGFQSNSCDIQPKEQNEDSEELSITEQNHEEEEEEATEKIVIEGIEKKAESSKEMGTESEAKETTEQSVPQALQIDSEKVLLSATSSPPLKPQDQKQDTLIGSESSVSFGEFFLTKAACLGSENLAKQTLVSTIGLQSEEPGQVLPHYAETEKSANQPAEQFAEVERSLFSSAYNEAQEIAGRVSTGLIPENPIAQVQIRKCPSFDFDLSLEARSEESDRTPLLLPDKSATISPIAKSKSVRDVLQYQAISVEKKTIKVERSDSDKSRAPFMNFLKEKEKASVVVKSQKELEGCFADEKAEEHSWAAPNERVAMIKQSGKRKPRSSLFSTCICCAATIN